MELIGIAVLSFGLGMALIAVDKVKRENSLLKHDKEEIEERARQRAMKMVEGARDRALAIVEEAQIRTSENKGVVESELARVSEKQIGVYKDILQSISKEIELDAHKEVEDFRKVLETEAAGVQKTMAAKIEEEMRRAEQQVEEYKKDKMRLVDEKAEVILKEFIKRAYPKVLSLDDQIELITRALTEAKKQYGI